MAACLIAAAICLAAAAAACLAAAGGAAGGGQRRVPVWQPATAAAATSAGEALHGGAERAREEHSRGSSLGLWPWPTGSITTSGLPLRVAGAFRFEGPANCPRLDRALARYRPLVVSGRPGEVATPAASSAAGEGAPLLEGCRVEVEVLSSCQAMPQLGDDEGYELEVLAPRARLRATSFAGAVRGLETLAQLVTCDADGCAVTASNVRIEDKPRFQWRGTMLDTARHFLPVGSLLKMLDAMAANKLNVLHWHITDAQSFPLQTVAYPKLVKGAYSPGLAYSHGDVTAVVAAAADRAIRVVPELDTPGHAASWAVGYPELVIPGCSTLDITSEATFAMLEAVYKELASLFPDAYVHLGTDEVTVGSERKWMCWNSSNKVARWMDAAGVPRTDLGFKGLTARYITRLQKIVKALGRTPVVWQEAFDHYGNSSVEPTPPPADLDPDTIVEQWFAPPWNWANLSSIVEPGYLGRNVSWPRGFRALTTNGWYLDSTEVNSWEKVYAMEPLTNQTCTYNTSYPKGFCSCTCPGGPWRDGRCHCFDLRGTRAAATEAVLGGEAPLWGEFIDSSNLFPRAFPRLSAVAERLWSRMEVNNATEAAGRLEKQRCRMLRRGVEVTPLGPGFCPELPAMLV